MLQSDFCHILILYLFDDLSTVEALLPKIFFKKHVCSREADRMGNRCLGKSGSAVALAIVLLSGGALGEAGAAGFEILKPHRAVYEVKLEDSTDRSGISNMTGRIVYEMEGNECDGISVRYRFVTTGQCQWRDFHIRPADGIL